MSEIAVIMSVYKNDKLFYLQESLESLYGQTLAVDIFVQLDGIVSEEIEIFLDDALSNKKISYLGKREKNIGLAGSLNELLAVVLPSYNYIARMDADDISQRDRIEAQYHFMEKHLEVDVVGGYMEEFGEDIEYKTLIKYPLEHGAMFDFFAKRVPLAHVSAFFRESFFEKSGLYPTKSSTNEDTLLWMQGFKHKAIFANIPHVVVKVRISKSFFNRRGGLTKAWSDFKDRILVIKTLRYNPIFYGYALALFGVNMAPPKIKQFLYKRLR